MVWSVQVCYSPVSQYGGSKPEVVNKKSEKSESQAARQGLAVFMASASVVLKQETSTLR